MTKARQREIVIEFERTELIRKRTKTNWRLCRECGRETDFLLLETASALLEFRPEELLRIIEVRHGHRAPVSGGGVEICLHSLFSGAGLEIRMINGDAHIRQNAMPGND